MPRINHGVLRKCEQLSPDGIRTVMDRIQKRFSPAECEKLEEMLTVINQELMPEIHLPSVEDP